MIVYQINHRKTALYNVKDLLRIINEKKKIPWKPLIYFFIIIFYSIYFYCL